MKTAMLRILIAILLASTATMGLSYFVEWYDRPDPHFSYNSGNSNETYIQILTGQQRVVPFTFEINEGVREVRLEIVDEEFWGRGATLADLTVPVEEGLVSSHAMFKFAGQPGLKPGTYRLQLLARDTASGRVLRTGMIPFIVDMEEIIAKCSC